jgi:predicted nucleic acid-binding protein
VALICRHLIDTSVLARMSQPAVAAAPVVPLINAGLVGTCAVLDLEALYGARTGAHSEAIRTDRRRAYEYLPTHDEQWQRALDVQGALPGTNSGRSASPIC